MSSLAKRRIPHERSDVRVRLLLTRPGRVREGAPGRLPLVSLGADPSLALRMTCLAQDDMVAARRVSMPCCVGATLAVALHGSKATRLVLQISASCQSIFPPDLKRGPIVYPRGPPPGRPRRWFASIGLLCCAAPSRPKIGFERCYSDAALSYTLSIDTRVDGIRFFSELQVCRTI